MKKCSFDIIIGFRKHFTYSTIDFFKGWFPNHSRSDQHQNNSINKWISNGNKTKNQKKSAERKPDRSWNIVDPIQSPNQSNLKFIQEMKQSFVSGFYFLFHKKSTTKGKNRKNLTLTFNIRKGLSLFKGKMKFKKYLSKNILISDYERYRTLLKLIRFKDSINLSSWMVSIKFNIIYKFFELYTIIPSKTNQFIMIKPSKKSDQKFAFPIKIDTIQMPN